MVRYSSSGYSTITLISWPSTFRVVASTPLSICFTMEPMRDALRPSAAAITGSTFTVTMGAVFSMLECTLITSSRSVISFTILSLTSFSSSYWVP